MSPTDREWVVGEIRTLGRKLEPSDLTDARFYRVAETYAKANQESDFAFLAQMGKLVQDGKPLSPGKAKGVLNCLRAQLNKDTREQQEKQEAAGRPKLPLVVQILHGVRNTRELVNPKIHIRHPQMHLRLNIAGANARVPDSINVIKVNGYGNSTWLGRILPEDGEVRVSHKGAVDILQQMNVNPASFLAKMGKLSGHCCYCNLPLTDERSLQAGYGPICAKHYALEWGQV